jgi:hypothetical protein
MDRNARQEWQSIVLVLLDELLYPLYTHTTAKLDGLFLYFLSLSLAYKT